MGPETGPKKPKSLTISTANCRTSISQTKISSFKTFRDLTRDSLRLKILFLFQLGQKLSTFNVSSQNSPNQTRIRLISLSLSPNIHINLCVFRVYNRLLCLFHLHLLLTPPSCVKIFVFWALVSIRSLPIALPITPLLLANFPIMQIGFFEFCFVFSQLAVASRNDN